MVDFSGSFARLTAHFVGLDLKLLNTSQSSEETRLRDLTSTPFLGALITLTKGETNRLDDVKRLELDLRDDIFDIVHMFRSYHKAMGGSLLVLSQLMLLQVDLIPRFPRVIDNLGPICQM